MTTALIFLVILILAAAVIFAVPIIIVLVILRSEKKQKRNHPSPVFYPSPYVVSQQKGIQGELTVSHCLGPTVPGERYVINDLILVAANGTTSQIDHVLIDSKGVLVVETKNYSGRIYGNATQKEWTQVLAYGEVKHKLYNPVMQNQTHIKRITEAIGDNVPIGSAIVFVQGNIEHINAPYVYNMQGLQWLVSAKSDIEFPAGERTNVYQKLMTLKSQNAHLRSQHILNAQQAKMQASRKYCPHCRALMIQQDTPTGTFYYCSNYPNCTYHQP